MADLRKVRRLMNAYLDETPTGFSRSRWEDSRRDHGNFLFGDTLEYLDDNGYGDLSIKDYRRIFNSIIYKRVNSKKHTS